MKLNKLIPDLIEIARNAGEAILKIYESGDFGIEKKSDDSPLTIADKASNEIICRGLENLSVDFPIISEENKMMDYAHRKEWPSCWLVDPLDGTKEFIKRNGDFTVNIALVQRGKAVLGIVGIPTEGEIYWALKGEGSYLVKNGFQEKIQVKNYKNTDANLKILASRSHLNQETKDFVSAYKKPILISRGSALKFLLVAKGDAHIYPRIAPTMEWDTAAAQIVLEEAGGKVLVYETGQPLTYNREILLNPSFIARGNLVDGS